MINLSPVRVKTDQTLKRVKTWWSQPEPPKAVCPEPVVAAKKQGQRDHLSALARDEANLPDFVRACPVTMKYLRLMGRLDWSHFPERSSGAWPGPIPHPRAPYLAAYLVKMNEGHKYMTTLRTYLLEHPALVWVLGFRVKPNEPDLAYPFEAEAVVPSAKQLGRVLRELPPEMGAFLLQSTVQLLKSDLPDDCNFGQDISMDTKHILAWVKENNPKAYVSEYTRLTKTSQPKGDPDCKLGCKKKRNKPPTDDAANQPITNFSSQDRYYWGYASGVVATKIDGWAEVVLAEMTQPFNADDTTYFHPLMAQTEANLGFAPHNGAFDAAWDAFYVYDYFAANGGIAAVPFSGKGGEIRLYTEDNLPLCEAGLPMPLKSTFTARTGLVPQPKGRYACPLLYPDPNGQSCPIAHRHWPKGGCLSTLGTSPGALMRHQLDREGPRYQAVYKQRTATERINAQATEHGIERPRLRNFKAIARHNTLLYVLLNLKALQRVQAKKLALASEVDPA